MSPVVGLGSRAVMSPVIGFGSVTVIASVVAMRGEAEEKCSDCCELSLRTGMIALLMLMMHY